MLVLFGAFNLVTVTCPVSGLHPYRKSRMGDEHFSGWREQHPSDSVCTEEQINPCCLNVVWLSFAGFTSVSTATIGFIYLFERNLPSNVT